MMRRSSLSLILSVLVGSWCAAQLPPVPTFHGDYQRTGRSGSAGPVRPDMLWSFRAGSSFSASPVIAGDGTIYVAATSGELAALDPEGHLKWQFNTAGPLFATPSLDATGTLHFGDTAGWFYAVRPDGTLKWKHLLEEGSDRRVLGSAAVSPDGQSYVAAWNDRLYVLDPAGNIRWRIYLHGLPTSAPALDAAGNAYIACLDSPDDNRVAVYKFGPNSSVPVWHASRDIGINRHRVISSPAVDTTRNRLYVGACAYSDGPLLAFDLTTGQAAGEVVLPKGIVSSPAIAPDGTVLVGCLDGKLYAIDPDGMQERWSFQADGLYILGSPTVDRLGNGYVGDSDGTLYALSPSGGELWRFATEANIESAPVVHDGRIYVTSFDSRLYAVGAADTETRYFPQVANGADRASRLETQFRFTNTGDASLVQLEFFDSAGSPMALPLESGQALSLVTLPLGRGQSVSLRTTGAGNLQVGYARVTASRAIGAAAVLKYSEGLVVMYETGVPTAKPSTDLTFFLDSGDNRGMGLAVVNTTDQAANLKFRLYSPEFVLIAEKTMQDVTGQAGLPKGGHLARFAFEIFPELRTSGVGKGIITVESNQTLAAVALCQDGDPAKSYPDKVTTLSLFPVAEGRPELASPPAEPSVFYFPQIADGESGQLKVQTVLYFVDLKEDALIRLEFFDNQGPMALDIVGHGKATTIEFMLKRGEVVTLQTAGTSSLVSGYAKVSTSSGVTGTAVYHYSAKGVTLFEATVPASTSGEQFSLFVEQGAGGLKTAVGMMNVGDQAAGVRVRVYDTDFHLIGEDVLFSILPGDSLTRYLSELVPESLLSQCPGGIVTIVSDQPLAVLSLREAGEASFPDEVYRLTFMPVIAGTAAP